jgi:hypothetical protein
MQKKLKEIKEETSQIEILENDETIQSFINSKNWLKTNTETGLVIQNFI